jgi:hypothetical protein
MTQSGSFTNQQSSTLSRTSMSKEILTRLPKRLCRECASHGLTLELSNLKMLYMVAKSLLLLILLDLKLHNNLRKPICMLAWLTLNHSWRCVSTCYRNKSKSKSKSILHYKIKYSSSSKKTKIKFSSSRKKTRIKFSSSSKKTNRAWENRKTTLRISWVLKGREAKMTTKKKSRKWWKRSICWSKQSWLKIFLVIPQFWLMKRRENLLSACLSEDYSMLR